MKSFANLNIILLCSLLILSCRKEKEEERVGIHKADKTIQNFKVVETVRGKILWRLDAKKANIYSDTTVVNDLKLIFYDQDGNISSVLTADTGYTYPSGDLLARGGVHVESVDPRRILTTKTLYWKHEGNKIVSKDSVTIFTEDGLIKGTNFESNPDLTEIKLQQMVGVGEER